MASPACTLYSLHPYPALLQCATSCYNKNNNLQREFLLGHSFFTPPKHRLVLCDSDDGLFLEGESQNVAHDYYCSTSIYLVWISWHLLTFTITPTPSWIKKVLGRWRHSTEFRSGFGSKSWSTSVMVFHIFDKPGLLYMKQEPKPFSEGMLYFSIQFKAHSLTKVQVEEVTCVWFGNYKVCPRIKYEGKSTNETERAWNLGLLVKCMLKSHFERHSKLRSYLVAKSSVVWPTYQSFPQEKKKKSFRWIYLRRKRSFKTTAQGPGSTSEHELSCYIFRIIPFIRGMRDISGILGPDWVVTSETSNCSVGWNPAFTCARLLIPAPFQL